MGAHALWRSLEFGEVLELRFPNGSLIMFRYAEILQGGRHEATQGGQRSTIGVFDERTHHA